MAGPVVVVDEVLLDQVDGERHGVAQRYRAPLHRRDLVFVVHVKYLLLELEPRSAHERLACFVWLFLLAKSRSDLLADVMTCRASVCYVVCVFISLIVLKYLLMVLDIGILLSKMSRLNCLSFALSVLLLSLLFSLKNIPTELFVVVVLVRDAVDAFQLVRVPRGYDDVVGFALAVSLDPCEVPHRTEYNISLQTIVS